MTSKIFKHIFCFMQEYFMGTVEANSEGMWMEKGKRVG